MISLAQGLSLSDHVHSKGVSQAISMVFAPGCGLFGGIWIAFCKRLAHFDEQNWNSHRLVDLPDLRNRLYRQVGR
jgi:hypothetical protein